MCARMVLHSVSTEAYKGHKNKQMIICIYRKQLLMKFLAVAIGSQH